MQIKSRINFFTNVFDKKLCFAAHISYFIQYISPLTTGWEWTINFLLILLPYLRASVFPVPKDY